MDNKSANLFFEKREGSDTLVIAFTGFADKLMLHPFEFFQLTGTMGYSRILVRDPSKRLCLGGIDDTLNSFEKTIEELRNLIAKSGATCVMTIGTSGGAFTAILAGHFLKADFVHAFAPYTYTNLLNIVKYLDLSVFYRFWRSLAKIYQLSFRAHGYFDLRKILNKWNGVTKYFVHICKQHKRDYSRAAHLATSPNVEIFEYYCKAHTVVIYLHKQGLLRNILIKENQNNLADILTREEC
jgi:hypothetical protein